MFNYLPITLPLAAWVHDLNPYAIGPFYLSSGEFGVRWYGLSYLLGFLLGYLLIRRVAKVGKTSFPVERAGDLVVTLAIGIVVGGRLGYVFFYQPHLLWTFQNSIPYWNLIAINDGGMSSHGGMIGGIAACVYFAWHHKQKPLFIADLLCFGGPLGLFFGRIANFLNGELYGRGPANIPWAVKFPRAMYSWPEDKIQTLYHSLPPVQNFLPGKNHWTIPDVIRLIQDHNQTVTQTVKPMLVARHPSQIYEAIGEGLVVFIVLLFIWRKPRKPGVVTAWFGIVYAIVRFIDEYWRQPDSFIGYEWLHLTRGQWLSIALFIVAVALLIWSVKRKSQTLGSWRKKNWNYMEKS